MNNSLTSSHIKQLAYDSGFDLCGIASPDILPESRLRYFEWLKHSYHGEMSYLAKDPDRRTDPRELMADAESIIMLGLNYYSPNTKNNSDNFGRVSRYARGKDYHKVMERGIKKLIHSIAQEITPSEKPAFRWYVDYGPLSERSYAEEAGLGFIGKNGMLINRKFGSWFFLAEILTTLKLEPDNRNPMEHGHCGDCRLCIDACPTGAIVSPRTIDSTRCISYLTIERPSKIPAELASKMGDMVFGCDICQEVCPYNGNPIETTHAELAADNGVGEFLNLTHLLALQSHEEFLELTAGTPLTRPKLPGLQRSAAIARANLSGVTKSRSPKD